MLFQDNTYVLLYLLSQLRVFFEVKNPITKNKKKNRNHASSSYYQSYYLQMDCLKNTVNNFTDFINVMLKIYGKKFRNHF